jgi:hypothetical protein
MLLDHIRVTTREYVNVIKEPRSPASAKPVQLTRLRDGEPRE